MAASLYTGISSRPNAHKRVVSRTKSASKIRRMHRNVERSDSHTPTTGVVSEEAGVKSVTINWKTENVSNTVTLRDSRSASAGRQ